MNCIYPPRLTSHIFYSHFSKSFWPCYLFCSAKFSCNYSIVDHVKLSCHRFSYLYLRTQKVFRTKNNEALQKKRNSGWQPILTNWIQMASRRYSDTVITIILAKARISRIRGIFLSLYVKCIQTHALYWAFE